MRKTSSFILICVLVFFGCTGKKTSDVCDVIITPPVLDFGRARIEDSPISFSFALENASKEPLKIVDISSGCGCTGIDTPQEPILPNEKKSFEVKVDLRGRSGEFTNTVFIKTAEHGNFFIDIRGTIVTDIWFSGQSIRLTAEPGKSEAKTTFSLFTQDYPNVQFDWSDVPSPSGVEIQEISRSVSDGICNIQFALSVSIGDTNALSHRLVIVPKETGITPLVLPIYCYRNETDQRNAAFSTKQISLGVIARNEARIIKIYGNPDVIHGVKEIAWSNVPSGIITEILPRNSDTGGVLEVSLEFTDAFPKGFFGGEIRLNTLGGQEFAIPVNGEVSE